MNIIITTVSTSLRLFMNGRLKIDAIRTGSTYRLA